MAGAARPCTLFALALIVGLPAAHAHVGSASDRTELLAHPDLPDRPAVDESFGLLEREPADGRWRWTCHELVSEPGLGVLPTLRRSGDGVLLATSLMRMAARVPGESVLRSEDGCDWSPPIGLTDQPVWDLAFDPGDPSLALAVTAAMPDEEVEAERIFRSTDAGATWSPVLEVSDGRVFTSVSVSEAGPAWALAVRAEPAGAWTYRSLDRGLTWTERPLRVEGEIPPSVLIGALDPVEPLRAWLLVDGASQDLLARTDDGGEAWAVEHRSDGLLRDIAIGPAARWLVDGEVLLRATPGEDWQPVDCAPQVRGVRPWEGGVLLATNVLAGDEAVVTLQLGEDGSCSSETQLLTLGIDGPRTCAPDSDLALVCGPLYEDLMVQIERLRPRPSPVDPPVEDDPEPPGACEGCESGGGAAALGLVLLPALSLRRRASR